MIKIKSNWAILLFSVFQWFVEKKWETIQLISKFCQCVSSMGTFFYWWEDTICWHLGIPKKVQGLFLMVEWGNNLLPCKEKSMLLFSMPLWIYNWDFILSLGLSHMTNEFCMALEHTEKRIFWDIFVHT